MRWMLPTLLVAACNPYNRSGDYYAGAIDPSGFPAAYTGDGFDPQGMWGRINPAPATTVGASGQGVEVLGYFAFPVPAGVDPLVLKQIVDNIPEVKPLGYVFDGDPSVDTSKCTPPDNYVYDERTDFVHFDHQANVFQQRQVKTGPHRDPPSLPSEDGYVPIYAEVAVASNGEDCQSVKSAEGIVANDSVDFPGGKAEAPPGVGTKAVGLPDGKYLAMAIIDPAADVWAPVPDGNGSITLAQDPHTFLGPQRFGFFDHYLVAYIEGGYVPSTPMVAPDGTTMSVIAKFMTIYVTNQISDPNTHNTIVYYDPRNGVSDMNNPMIPVQKRAPGIVVGTDGKSGKRGQPGYSPICQLHTYTPAVPQNLPTSIDQITPLMVDPEPAGATFFYCLQVVE